MPGCQDSSRQRTGEEAAAESRGPILAMGGGGSQWVATGLPELHHSVTGMGQQITQKHKDTTSPLMGVKRGRLIQSREPNIFQHVLSLRNYINSLVYLHWKGHLISSSACCQNNNATQTDPFAWHILLTTLTLYFKHGLHRQQL